MLLGPDGAAFWPVFRASPEYADGCPDPLDRWSRRVIGDLAADRGAAAVFPFDGPPWVPFLTWAVRSGRAWPSPIGMLVHARFGLFLSFRGALVLAGEEGAAGEPEVGPCAPCAQPCLTACPVGALGGAGYDVAACRAYLDRPEGDDCRTRGCAVRRACPVGAGLRPDDQSAFHMANFHGRQATCRD